MDQMRIRGGKALKGKINISGAKNAALPLLAASLLTDEPLRLKNVPQLADITAMGNLLTQHGVQIGIDGAKCGPDRVLELTAKTIASTTAPYDLVRKMRASILVLGPLMARCRKAKVSLPGGCAIGTRPVDLHISALAQMGAEITLDDGYINAAAPQGLHGANIAFPCVSVTGTENVLMAAVLAKGETVITNAAQEPEVGDLAACLVAMGAQIEGIGTNTLRIAGKDRLRGATHTVIADRIEAGTFAMAVATAHGELELCGVRMDALAAVFKKLKSAGIESVETADGIRVTCFGPVNSVDVTTEPFPGFPTDLQAQIMAIMCTAQGTSKITETIFENRFMHVPELRRMGANIEVHGNTATVRGVPGLTGAPVMATDLRASVSLVLAGLGAEGDTMLSRVYHLDRGYERLEEKLSACGAEIERVKE